MRIFSIRQSKTCSRYFVISVSLLLLLFITSLPCLAQDDNSIDAIRQMGKAFAKIAENASPAVVGIKTEKTVTQSYQSPFGDQFDPFGDDFFDYFFRRQSPRQRSPQREYHQSAQGSGFIISVDGYILTNNHMVENAEKVTIKLGDGRDFEAKIIGTDPDSDVAVVKIDANNLPILELADSDTLEVGEWILAIGNPFGLSHTVTAGIVSAKGRSGVGLTTYEDFIQTDAAINPGNSGGPLLNLDGKVVGINTAIVSRSGGNIGIGLAIPINMAKVVYDQLLDSGTVTRGFLGVTIQDLTADLADSFGLKKDTKGVLIPEVSKDSAAEKAGLKQGDVIVEFDGQPVEKANVLQNRVAMLKPGTKVKVVVLRDGKRETLTVKLGKRPSEDEIASTRPDALGQLGLSVQELTGDLAERFGYQGLSGVIISQVEAGSLAERAGIKRGMLIIEVNRTQISNTKEFNKAIEQASKADAVLLLINNGQYNQFVVLPLVKK